MYRFPFSNVTQYSCFFLRHTLIDSTTITSLVCFILSRENIIKAKNRKLYTIFSNLPQNSRPYAIKDDDREQDVNAYVCRVVAVR